MFFSLRRKDAKREIKDYILKAKSREYCGIRYFCFLMYVKEVGEQRHYIYKRMRFTTLRLQYPQ